MNGGPRIALDAMGGDSGPAGMIAGAARALRRDPSLHFIVYGDQAEVETELDNHRPEFAPFDVYDVAQTLVGSVHTAWAQGCTTNCAVTRLSTPRA